MTSQTLKLILTEIVLFLSICGIAYIVCDAHKKVYQQALINREVHPLCKDTPTKTAWVAYRDGVPRCFLENNGYPKRASGSNISVPIE